MCARKRISLNDKLNLINDYKKGARVFELSVKYKLKSSTVSKIIKCKDNFIKTAEKFCNLTKRKFIKNGEFPRMDKKLYDWFVRQRKLHIPISGVILQQQAKKIPKKCMEADLMQAMDGLLALKNDMEYDFSNKVAKNCQAIQNK